MASGLEELAAKYEQAQHNAQKAMALFKATREENEVLLISEHFYRAVALGPVTSRHTGSAVRFVHVRKSAL
jgi:hypothetical protein